MGVSDWLFNHGKTMARAGYTWLAIGLGLVFALQRDVMLLNRDALNTLPIPFWVYGVLLLVLGLTELFATVTDNSKVMSYCMISSTLLWIYLGGGFGVAAVMDPVHVPFTGLVTFWFIALMHVIGAGIEASRAVIQRAA